MSSPITIAKDGQAVPLAMFEARLAQARAAGADDSTLVEVCRDETLQTVCVTIRFPLDVESMSGPDLLKELRGGHPDNGPAVWAEIERRLGA